MFDRVPNTIVIITMASDNNGNLLGISYKPEKH